MIDMIVCSILTIIVIASAFTVSLRAFLYALKLEHAEKSNDPALLWVCSSVNAWEAKKDIYLIGAASMMLCILKLISLIDVFITLWEQMTVVYHILSYSFIVENLMWIYVGWRWINHFHRMERCENARKLNCIENARKVR